MPIAPCFDPTTGASGGATPAASASLYNLSPTLVDLTDGTWTLLDPDSLVSGVTFASATGYNTVTWNALAAGSSNYNWAAGTTHRGPRWYKLLTVSGSQVTSVNHLVLTTKLQHDPAAGDFSQAALVGAAFDPTSTTSTTIDGSGGYFTRVGTGNPAFGTWQVGGATTATNVNNLYGVSTVMRGHNAVGSGVYLNSTASDTIIGSGSRNSNQNTAAVGVVNVHIMVGVGTRGSSDTVTAGDVQVLRMEYNATTVDVT